VTKPEDLHGEAWTSFQMWRRFGLSESAAMAELRTDGLLPPLSEEEADAKRFQTIFPGMSDAAARDAARGRNPEPPTDHHARVAESLKRSFDLTDHQAQIAATGRDGAPRDAPSMRPVSEAEFAALRPDPQYIGDVIRKIYEVAGDYVRRGIPEEKALQEAAFGMMRHMPNDVLADWVARIVNVYMPGVWPASASGGGGQVSESPAGKPGSSGRRSGTVRG
jgi:hypothetical protein